MTRQELTQPKLTLRGQVQIETEEGQEQKTTKRNQEVRSPKNLFSVLRRNLPRAYRAIGARFSIFF